MDSNFIHNSLFVKTALQLVPINLPFAIRVLFAAGVYDSGAGGSLFLEDVGTFLSRIPLIRLVFGNPFNPSNKELKKLAEMASGDPTTESKDFIYLKSAMARYFPAQMSYSVMLMKGKEHSINVFTRLNKFW